MNKLSGLINGLLLLGRLHLKSKATIYNNKVFFEILVEDFNDINNDDKQLLEDWKWCLTESEDLDVWSWYKND